MEQNSPFSEGELYFIAEAGVNHNGSVTRAKKMIDIAEDAGADAVKFQAYVAEASVTASEEKAEYQKKNTDRDESQLEMLRKYELSREDHADLQSYCENKDIDFITTISTIASINKIKQLDLDILKFGSPDINNFPSLKYAAKLNTPLIISTGMSYMEEVDKAVEYIRKHNAEIELALLHCVSNYPADPEELNLRVIRKMEDQYSLPVGFSDHTTQPETPAIAVGFGAKIIEKHFTLDKNLPGPDHSASLGPTELKEAIRLARLAFSMRGVEEKKPTLSEKEKRPKIRRSIHANLNIEQGSVISEDSIRVCRPADGIPPTQYQEVIGSKALTEIESGEPITENKVDI